MTVKFLGFIGWSRNIRFTTNSKAALSRPLFAIINSWAMVNSSSLSFLYAFFNHAWVLKLLNLLNLSIQLLYTISIRKQIIGNHPTTRIDNSYG